MLFILRCKQVKTELVIKSVTPAIPTKSFNNWSEICYSAEFTQKFWVDDVWIAHNWSVLKIS